MKNLIKSSLLAAAGIIVASTAQATIISASGPAIMSGDASGADLRRNVTQNAAVQGYDENQNVRLTTGVEVDYLVGDNLSFGSAFTGINSASSSRTLGAGLYDSHLLHFDSDGASGISNAIFTFSGDIVAVILSNEGSVGRLLNASDSVFGNAAAYENNGARRAENNDSFTFGLAGTNVLTIDFEAVNDFHIDNVRVITASVPEPSSLVLAALGLAGVGLARRKKVA